MITEDKITEIFCAVDEFCKEFAKEVGKKSLMSTEGKPCLYRKASFSDSNIMTILIVQREMERQVARHILGCSCRHRSNRLLAPYPESVIRCPFTTRSLHLAPCPLHYALLEHTCMCN